MTVPSQEDHMEQFKKYEVTKDALYQFCMFFWHSPVCISIVKLSEKYTTGVNFFNQFCEDYLIFVMNMCLYCTWVCTTSWHSHMCN